jgi:site-specific DNA-cytosine methylase
VIFLDFFQFQAHPNDEQQQIFYKKMKVLIACEYSGVVRDAFLANGHDAWSCDLLPTDSKGPHIQGDVLQILDKGWDLMIAHPPCTHLAASGARWFKNKEKEQKEALDFVRLLLNAPIEKIALENPVSIISTKVRQPDQIVHPWMFGHEISKTTCLWLKNLPLLIPTEIVGKGKKHTTKGGKVIPEWYNLPETKDRWKKRSKTFEGFAKAMADQWS